MSLLQQLAIKHPIFLAPMAGVSTPKLAAEVSNQGGLGSLGLGANTPQSAREQILKTQALTENPFQVNFFCHQSTELNVEKAKQWLEYLRPHFEKFGAQPPQELHCIYPSFLDNDDFLNVVLETKPKAVSFHFGIPHPHQIKALKEAGILTMVSATNLIEARLLRQRVSILLLPKGLRQADIEGFSTKLLMGQLKLVTWFN